MQPGRVDSRRPVPVRLALAQLAGRGRRVRALGRILASRAPLLAACAALLSACAGASPPHRELAPLWRDYRALPGERALAIAGELRHDQWVAGASGGNASGAEAAARALAECRRRRAQRRMQAPCQLFAVGDEVVWPRL